MSELAKCPQCGKELSAEAPQGLCPACLLQLGLSGAIPALPEPPPSPSLAEPPPSPSNDPPRAKIRWRRWLAIAATLGVAAFAAAVLAIPRRPSLPPVVRFRIPAPQDANLAISPDGMQLAYSAGGRLSLQPLDTFSAREIAGGEGAQLPFWSPDSQHLGFWSQGKLKTITVQAAGPAQIVCDAPRFAGGAWSRDGNILFSNGQVLLRVASVGGPPQTVSQLDSWGQEMTQRVPQPLPDPKRFLFTAISPQPENTGIYAYNSGHRTKVLAGSTMAAAAQGYLLAVRDGQLIAYPFDEARMQIHGDVRLVRFAEQVRSFSVAGNTLAYWAGPGPRTQLMWFDRSGRGLGGLGEPAEGGSLSLSPDGAKAAVVRDSGVWLLDLARDTTMRLTFGPGTPTAAVWSPDGTRIAFGTQQGSGSGIFVKQVNGAGNPEMLFRSPNRLVVDSWSPDGRVILFHEEEISGKSAIWELLLEPERKPMPILRSDFALKSARLSPDGRWMAYVSNESGRDEIYVQTFPGPNGKWIISAAGGSDPDWRGDGKEMYFRASENTLMSVAMEAGPQALRPGIPQILFRAPNIQSYAASADGKRFLVAITPEDSEPGSIDIVLNWREDLER